MARTVAVIHAQIKAEWAATPELVAANSTSATAIWNLVTYIIAVAIGFFEQLLDIAKAEIETIAEQAIPGTESWVQRQVLDFQYSATNPQVVSLIDFVPIYPVVDTTLRIITKCSVVTNTNNIVMIKVATASGVLSGPQVAALTSYLDVIMFAGVRYQIVNLVADKISIGGVVYYNGQYSSVISATVIATINNYLANLPFNGIVKISDIEAAILAVTGVTDVKINYIFARQDAIPFANAYVVYNLSSSINNRIWNTVSGSIVEETTLGQGFATTINFVIA